MANITGLEEALALALKLAPKERLQLVERVVSSVEREFDKPSVEQPTEHWGKALNQLLDELGPIDLVDPEIEDPVEWVKAQRQKEADRLKSYWEGEQ